MKYKQIILTAELTKEALYELIHEDDNFCIIVDNNHKYGKLLNSYWHDLDLPTDYVEVGPPTIVGKIISWLKNNSKVILLKYHG